MKKIRFLIKQFIKMFLQNFVLPCIYCVNCFINEPDKDLVVLADAHHDCMPASMMYLAKELNKTNKKVVYSFSDYGNMSMLALTKELIGFMKLYSKAGYVFICDNMLPIASCTRRKETTVVQLWHGAGAFKKFGYDTTDDIPAYYHGNVFKNYDLVTVSAKNCILPFSTAMRQDISKVKALGVSRTDNYFDDEFITRCRNQFYSTYPEAMQKKILLWAPTFRENHDRGLNEEMQHIYSLQKQLGSEWFVIAKLHPRTKCACDLVMPQIITEELLPIVDFFVTDFSSIIFDYLLFEKPYAFLISDFDKYESERGFYTSPMELSDYIARNATELFEFMMIPFDNNEREKVRMRKMQWMMMCDGKATERILNEVGIEI